MVTKDVAGKYVLMFYEKKNGKEAETFMGIFHDRWFAFQKALRSRANKEKPGRFELVCYDRFEHPTYGKPTTFSWSQDNA